MSMCVFFLGGAGATETDIKTWLADARAQRGDVQFTAYPWPRGAASDAHSAVTAAQKSGLYAKAEADIQASKSGSIFLVGHSSGCAIANAVARDLMDNDNIHLVVLDGFVPEDAKLIQRSTTQFWAAECHGATSRNYPSMSECAGARLNVFRANNCKTRWGLHFSLVNRAANDKTSIQNGYYNCIANLCWLPPLGDFNLSLNQLPA